MLRVSQMSFYRQSISNLSKLMSEQYILNSQISGGKRIEKPSDDPVGSITAQLSHRNLEQVDQYDVDVDHAMSWIEQAESSVSSMLDLLTRAQELAEQGATGTYDGAQRNIIAQELSGIMDQLLTLANTEVNGDHIFGGSRLDDPAATEALTAMNPASPNSANTGTGGIYALGTYRGDLSRTYAITVDAGYAGGAPSAANPMDLNVSYVDDWGRTITRQVTITGTGNGFAQEVGDGITIYRPKPGLPGRGRFRPGGGAPAGQPGGSGRQPFLGQPHDLQLHPGRVVRGRGQWKRRLEQYPGHHGRLDQLHGLGRNGPGIL